MEFTFTEHPYYHTCVTWVHKCFVTRLYSTTQYHRSYALRDFVSTRRALVCDVAWSRKTEPAFENSSSSFWPWPHSIDFRQRGCSLHGTLFWAYRGWPTNKTNMWYTGIGAFTCFVLVFLVALLGALYPKVSGVRYWRDNTLQLCGATLLLVRRLIRTPLLMMKM